MTATGGVKVVGRQIGLYGTVQLVVGWAEVCLREQCLSPLCEQCPDEVGLLCEEVVLFLYGADAAGYGTIPVPVADPVLATLWEMEVLFPYGADTVGYGTTPVPVTDPGPEIP